MQNQRENKNNIIYDCYVRLSFARAIQWLDCNIRVNRTFRSNFRVTYSEFSCVSEIVLRSFVRRFAIVARERYRFDLKTCGSPTATKDGAHISQPGGRG
jgi:hypothetical protein